MRNKAVSHLQNPQNGQPHNLTEFDKQKIQKSEQDRYNTHEAASDHISGTQCRRAERVEREMKD